ncbi:MAG: RNA 2',3'-cyclic phosphodiesterase [Bacteroidia bacterium]
MLIGEKFRRLFLAIDAPLEASEIIKLINKENPYLKNIRWMRLQNLHLTIYFIGNTHQNNFDKIYEISQNIISNFSSFTIYPENVCLMPIQHPRMIWIKYKTNPIFTELYHLLHYALKDFKLSSEQIYNEPIPHITLARFSKLNNNKIFIPEIEKINLQPIQITEIKMWETISSQISSDYKKHEAIIKLKK